MSGDKHCVPAHRARRRKIGEVSDHKRLHAAASAASGAPLLPGCALYDFQATHKRQMSIRAGESLLIEDSSNSDWFLVLKVCTTGAGQQRQPVHRGYVPAQYVRMMDPSHEARQAVPQRVTSSTRRAVRVGHRTVAEQKSIDPGTRYRHHRSVAGCHADPDPRPCNQLTRMYPKFP